ncbi:MAG: M55 family metallopeptidase [Chitinophagales bacterium]
MKVYISADMEGLAGVVSPSQLTRGSAEYEEARQLLLGEVRAAVAGASEAGAETIIVRDAHGSGLNLPLRELDARARYVLGVSQADRFPGLDQSFTAAVLLGYHAMAGTRGAVRDHTMSSADLQEVRLNGEPVGEIGLDAAIFGQFGVPVAVVSGDDKACAEARSFLPGVVALETKTAFGRHTALTLAPAAAVELIRLGVRDALRQLERTVPPAYRVDPPYELTLRYLSADLLDRRSFDGRASARVDALTGVYRGENLLEVFDRAFR